MTDVARCKYSDCNKKDECYRYIESDNAIYIEFQNICGENNEYKWFMKKKTKEVSEC